MSSVNNIFEYFKTKYQELPQSLTEEAEKLFSEAKKPEKRFFNQEKLWKIVKVSESNRLEGQLLAAKLIEDNKILFVNQVVGLSNDSKFLLINKTDIDITSFKGKEVDEDTLPQTDQFLKLMQTFDKLFSLDIEADISLDNLERMEYGLIVKNTYHDSDSRTRIGVNTQGRSQKQYIIDELNDKVVHPLIKQVGEQYSNNLQRDFRQASELFLNQDSLRAQYENNTLSKYEEYTDLVKKIRDNTIQLESKSQFENSTESIDLNHLNIFKEGGEGIVFIPKDANSKIALKFYWDEELTVKDIQLKALVLAQRAGITNVPRIIDSGKDYLLMSKCPGYPFQETDLSKIDKTKLKDQLSQLLQRIVDLNKAGVAVDVYNPSNFLYDEETGFSIIDLGLSSDNELNQQFGILKSKMLSYIDKEIIDQVFASYNSKETSS